ncbi:MAG: hypothetical protein AAF191_10005 [Verrucomicrobiota bacterium]
MRTIGISLFAIGLTLTGHAQESEAPATPQQGIQQQLEKLGLKTGFYEFEDSIERRQRWEDVPMGDAELWQAEISRDPDLNRHNGFVGLWASFPLKDKKAKAAAARAQESAAPSSPTESPYATQGNVPKPLAPVAGKKKGLTLPKPPSLQQLFGKRPPSDLNPTSAIAPTPTAATAAATTEAEEESTEEIIETLPPAREPKGWLRLFAPSKLEGVSPQSKPLRKLGRPHHR